MDAQVKTPSYKARLAELRWLSLQVRLLASGRRWPGLMAEIAVLLWHLGLAAPQNERGRLLAFGSHGYEQRLEALLGSRTLIEDMNSWRAVARTLQKLEQLTQETLHVVQRVVNDVAASFGLPVSHIDERHLEFTVNSHRLTVKIKERGEGPNTATVDVLDDTVIITTVPVVDQRALAEAVAWGIETAVDDWAHDVRNVLDTTEHYRTRPTGGP